jgi:hypothetical protein
MLTEEMVVLGYPIPSQELLERTLLAAAEVWEVGEQTVLELLE